MAFEDDFETVAGTKLYVSATRPTADTAVAYAALTWVEVGLITNVGSVNGREYSTATLSTVGNAHDREKKGSYKLPDAAFECAWNEADAGQIIIAAAANDYSIPAFKLKKQGTAERFFTAQVKSFIENNGASNDAVKGNFVLLRQSDTITA
ncbi:hypothetical protein [Janthinobacterium aquaticum]|uniref:hypothetical protein n=1 Tax=Janthinobacterium sp. FT58W TaxID=2654254 RepID=UPI001263EC9D|nr:hypothetical protein [Janthinobacterium sp. FT58W]KAB8042553.1 hypothetical protein GCM43_13595 [Janthinobacterium sp. FT58W]